MRYGTIVNYFPDKKFGFIQPDTGQDIFFHISALDSAETEIKVGQPVKYELTSFREAKASREAGNKARATDSSRSDQPKAKLVALIDKLPGATLADVEREKTSRHQRARKKKPTWRR